MSEAGKVWYLHNGKDQTGPMTLQEAVNALTSAPAGMDLLVWRTGMPDWKKAADVEPIRAALSAASNGDPLPPEELSNEPLPLTSHVESDGLSALIETRHSHGDDHTGSLDMRELKSAKKIAKKTTQMAATAKARREGKIPASTWRALLLLFIVALGAIGYTAWPLLTRPGGVYSRWMTRLPDSPDLTEDQRNLLQTAASSEDKDPATAPIEMVLTTAHPDMPMIYLAGNIVQSTVFKVEIKANSATIAGPAPATMTMNVAIVQRLGHSDPVRLANGTALPRGEYTATVIDNNGKARLTRKIWLGAPSDETYKAELAQFQQTVRDKAKSELQSLKDGAAKLSAVIEGDQKAAADAAKAKNAAAKARTFGSWTSNRNKLMAEAETPFKADTVYFKTVKSKASALLAALHTQETALFAFPGSSASRPAANPVAAPSGAPTPPQAPQTPEDSMRNVQQSQAALAAALNEAEGRVNSSTGIIEEEK